VTPIRQLGRTSLLIYWIHVELCYGFATKPLQKKLSFGQALAGYVLLCVLMYGLSLARSRYWPGLRERLRRRFSRGAR
jgi:hypothetical protein